MFKTNQTINKILISLAIVLLTIFISGCGGGKTEVAEETGGQSEEKTTPIIEETDKSEGESIGETKEETVSPSESEGESEEVEYTGEPAFEGGKVYVNKEYWYAITIPEEWDVAVSYPEVVSFIYNPSSDGRTAVSILWQNNPEQFSAQDWINNCFEWPYPNFCKHKFSEERLNGVKALKDQIKGDYFIALADSVFLIQRGFSLEGDLTEEEWQLYEKVVHTLKFIK